MNRIDRMNAKRLAAVLARYAADSNSLIQLARILHYLPSQLAEDAAALQRYTEGHAEAEEQVENLEYYQHEAARLYANGFRSDDFEELQDEYMFSDEEARQICLEIASLEAEEED